MNNIHENQHLDLSYFYKIDINLYPVFISIYQQKNISKAAHLLNVSQSAASHALNRLRQLLEDDLFIRVAGKMQPTPFAEQIYPNVLQALNAIQQISMQKNQFDLTQVKQLKIAMHDEIEPMILPKIVQHFQQLEIKIQLISVKLDRKNIVSELMTQQIDFAIDIENNFSKHLKFKALVQDHFVVCTYLNEMNSDIYFSSPHIGVSSRRTGTLLEDIYLQNQLLNRDIFLRCQHYSTALQILQQYPNAILTVPQSVLNHLIVMKNINIFQIPVYLPYLNVGMYWFKDLEDNLRNQFLRLEINKIFT